MGTYCVGKEFSSKQDMDISRDLLQECPDAGHLFLAVKTVKGIHSYSFLLFYSLTQQSDKIANSTVCIQLTRKERGVKSVNKANCS